MWLEEKRTAAPERPKVPKFKLKCDFAHKTSAGGSEGAAGAKAVKGKREDILGRPCLMRPVLRRRGP